MKVQAHFVEFFSPGTLFAESDVHEIASWDVLKAMKLADTITQRHGATPFGFQFFTKAREDCDLDSKEVKRSGMYYLGGKVETLKQVEARATIAEKTLVSNMRCNKYEKIITNTNSYQWTAPLRKGDTVLDYTPPAKSRSNRK